MLFLLRKGAYTYYLMIILLELNILIIFYLSLVLESVFSDQFQLLVETGLLERSPGSGECLPVVLGNFPVDHLVPSSTLLEVTKYILIYF